MDEELKHIDLIDKHLTGGLSGKDLQAFEELLTKNPNFKKEVEIYEDIYKKIEDKSEKDLKKRLAIYYKEYQNEKPARPKGLYRKLFIISGIAAILIFGVFLFRNNAVEDQDPIFKSSEPSVVEIETKDTLKQDKIISPKEVELAKEQTSKDSVFVPEKLEYDTELAIGGLKKLPSEYIRKVDYPVALQYTFNGTEVVLFGDPSMASLQLQVLKNRNGEYLLKYKERYYFLSKSTLQKPLKAVSNNYVMGQATQEKMRFKLKGVEKVTKVSKDLEVAYTENTSPNLAYYFEKKGEFTRLILTGNLDIESIRVYIVQTKTDAIYFLKLRGKLYKLNPKTTESSTAKDINILTDEITRLFREDRVLPEKTVYSVE